MGGYDANPSSGEPTPAATALEADANNTIGRQNRRDAGLPGYGGRSEEALAWQDNQTQITQQQRQQQQQQQQRNDGYVGGTKAANGDTIGGHPSEEQMAMDRASAGISPAYARELGIQAAIASRPRSMDISEFGDKNTQAAVAWLPEGQRFAAIGVELEKQRQAAELTPGTHDDRFFLNQLDLWKAQSVEGGSGEHFYKKQSTNPADWTANTRENEADIALAFEKAGNEKDNFGKNYAFNKNVGNILQVLPQRVNADGSMSPIGTQEYGWMQAVASDRNEPAIGRVSFMPAIDYLNSQRGRQGVYGDLAGGTPDTFTPLPKGFENGGVLGASPSTIESDSGMKRPFVSFLPEVPQKQGSGGFLNPFVATAGSGGEGGVQIDWAAKAPFKSSLTQKTVIQPTGEVDFFGVKATIPFLSIFQQPTIITTATGAPRETGTIFKVMAGGRDDFSFKMATSMDALESAPWVPSRGTVNVGEPSVSEPVLNPKTGLMEVTTTQKYQSWDLSKQTVIPKTTTTSAGKSQFEDFQGDASDRLYGGIGKVFGVTGEQARQSVAIADVFAREYGNNRPARLDVAGGWAVGTGMLKETLDRPVEGVAVLGVSAATGGVFRGIQGAGVMAAPTALKMFPRAAPVVGKMWNALPYVMGAAYTGQAASRTTEGFTNFERGNMESRFGGMLATETVPMIVGFGAGFYSPEIGRFGYNSAVKTPGKISDAIWEARQNYNGIQRIQKGSKYDFDVATGFSPESRPSIGEIGARDALRDDLIITRATRRTEFTPEARPSAIDFSYRDARINDLHQTRLANAGRINVVPESRMSAQDIMYRDYIRDETIIAREFELIRNADRRPAFNPEVSRKSAGDRSFLDAGRDDIFVTRATVQYRSKTPLYDMFAPKPEPVASNEVNPLNPARVFMDTEPSPRTMAARTIINNAKTETSLSYSEAFGKQQGTKPQGMQSSKTTSVMQVSKNNQAIAQNPTFRDVDNTRGSGMSAGLTPNYWDKSIPYWERESSLEESARTERMAGYAIINAMNRKNGMPQPGGEISDSMMPDNKTGKKMVVIPGSMIGRMQVPSINELNKIIPSPKPNEATRTNPLTEPRPFAQETPSVQPTRFEDPIQTKIPPMIPLPFFPGGSPGGQGMGRVDNDKYLHLNKVAVMGKGKKMKLPKFKPPRF